MPLEATMILLDNSSFALNGDYLPNRWMSQVDCASLLLQAKLEANRESSVGLGLMGGRQVDIICTLTNDPMKANSYLHGVKISGDLHFADALQVGSLALKYRANSNQKPRLICFVGSSISEDVETLVVLAKKLRKSQIAVDLVCFGDCSPKQKAKAEAFINNVNHEDNSYLIFVEQNDIFLNDVLIATRVFNNSGEQAAMPNAEIDDPELAQAIRMSLMEAQNQAVNSAPAPPVPAANITPVNPPAASSVSGSSPIAPLQSDAVDELSEEMIEQLTVQMSLEEQKKNEGKPNEQDKK